MHRVKQCFGLPVWRRTELWVCFSGVPAHHHPDQAFEVIPLFGWASFTRVTPQRIQQTVPIHPRNWFRALTVPAGWTHWFTTKFLVVLTVSDKPGSAARNIVFR